MIGTGLDFEKPIIELERKIEELKNFTNGQNLEFNDEIKKLEKKLQEVKREIFENLSPWQRVQIARHPKRPYTLDYVNAIMTDYIEIHGDRLFADDKALIAGFAKIKDIDVLVVGHQKGKDTKDNLMRNFGCAHPEGYRKAIRAMEMADKFGLPILSFVDTPGAYPGIGAEERGQSGAIAFNLAEMIKLRVPIIVTVIGEGGSGGALGIGVGDKVLILENAYYSVISPEGCAAILWKDRAKAPEAAGALKLTAADLLKLAVVDEIIKEPLGGAHRGPVETANNIKEAILRNLKELQQLSPEELIKARYKKYRKMGVYEE